MDFGFNFGVSRPSNGVNMGQQFNPATGNWETPTGYSNGNYTFASQGTASKTPAQVITDILTKGTDAVPDSLKSLATQSTSTLHSTAGVSAPVQQASDAVATYLRQLVGSGVPTYTGQRVAGLSDAEQQSLKTLQDMTAGVGAGQTGTDAMKRALGTTDTSTLMKAAGPVDTQKLTDVNIGGYMNPALQAEYDAILHGNDVMNNATRARLAKSGAFGANMDVAQAQNDESTKRQLALAGSDAFKTAQAAAMSDVAAENAGRQANRNAAMGAATTGIQTNLTDMQRQLTGGDMMNAQELATAQAAAGAGATQRGIEQAGLDAQWQQYLQKLGFSLQLGQTAASGLSALPTERTLTTEQLGPSAAGQELGAVIGLTGIQAQYNHLQTPSINLTHNAT